MSSENTEKAFDNIPEGWDCANLADCTTDGNISYGIVQPGQHTDGGIPIIRINNINNGHLLLDDVLEVAPEIEKKYKRTRLVGGEVLLTLVGSTGQSFVAPVELKGWNVPRAIAVIRPKEEIGAGWINICLQSKPVQRFLDVRANTTVQKTLNLKDVRDIPIPLPPKEIKQSIESIAVALQDKIRLNRQINQTLEEMAQALFKSWFVDFDPVIENALAAGNEIPEALKKKSDARQDLGDARRPLPEDIRSLFPSEFEHTEEMGWVPKGWRVSTVGEEFDVNMGQSPPGYTYNETGEGIPFFQGRADFGFRYPSERVYCTTPKRFADQNDTLVSVRAPVGDVNMAFDKCCIGRGIGAVRHKSSSRSYTYYSMLHLREHFNTFEAEGTVFGSISQKDFKGLKWLRCDKVLIENYEMLAGQFDEKIEVCFRNILALTNSRDTLLPQLLSGEIRIPEAEKLVEASV